MVEVTENPGLPLVCWYGSSSGLVCGIGLVVQLEVVLVGDYADGDRVGAADQLELGRNLGIGQGGVVAALAADDLERIGVGAFRLAIYDPGWLAAENHRPAVPGLITGHHARLLPASRAVVRREPQWGSGLAPRFIQCGFDVRAEHGCCLACNDAAVPGRRVSEPCPSGLGRRGPHAGVFSFRA